jgi:hypothetical protein
MGSLGLWKLHFIWVEKEKSDKEGRERKKKENRI